MGQKVNPIGFRTGVYRDWDSRWFARESYAELLKREMIIRDYIDARLRHAEIGRVEVEQTKDAVNVKIHASRVGTIIGKGGKEIEAHRRRLSKLLNGTRVDISVEEITRPELSALVVAKSIAEQLERRASYKKVAKRSSAAAMKSGAKGIKICIAGRLGGAEIARTEWSRAGSVPLHTIRAKIDYGFVEAKTTYGIIGIKVWICCGEYHTN